MSRSASAQATARPRPEVAPVIRAIRVLSIAFHLRSTIGAIIALKAVAAGRRLQICGPRHL
jgi:hypothetical protein